MALNHNHSTTKQLALMGVPERPVLSVFKGLPDAPRVLFGEKPTQLVIQITYVVACREHGTPVVYTNSQLSRFGRTR